MRVIEAYGLRDLIVINICIKRCFLFTRSMVNYNDKKFYVNVYRSKNYHFIKLYFKKKHNIPLIEVDPPVVYIHVKTDDSKKRYNSLMQQLFIFLSTKTCHFTLIYSFHS